MLRVFEREAFVFRQRWRNTVLTNILTPLLFLGAMGVGLGGLIDERSGTVEGLRYLDYVTPGLLAAASMQLGAFASLWSVMIGTTWNRYFHGMVAAPISAAGVYGGYVLWVGVRAAGAAAVFLAAAALLGGVPSWWGVLGVPIAALTALAFTAPITAFTATQENDQAFPLIARLGVMPLFLFSETFFPLSQLPSWVQPAAWLSPLWHGVSLLRAATVGRLSSVGAGRAVLHVVVLAAVVAAGWAWGRRTMTRKLAP